VELGPDLKLLVFDFDGTLLHLDVDWGDLRAQLGGDPDEPLGAVIQRLAIAGDDRLGLVTGAELAGLGQRRLDDEAVRVLVELRSRYEIAVYTRNSRDVVRRAVAGTPLADIHVVGREDCPLLKPDPAGLRLVLSHFGIAADNAAVVGDTYHDVQAAHAAGAHAVVVANPRLAYAPQGADRYVQRLADLLTLLA
jgi:HAD superfamily hydrolase (TIGR01549 family)